MLYLSRTSIRHLNTRLYNHQCSKIIQYHDFTYRWKVSVLLKAAHSHVAKHIKQEATSFSTCLLQCVYKQLTIMLKDKL